MEPLDLIVIGAGNAGLAAARVARRAGWRVLVVESRELGGTCPTRGCVPKKVLVAASETLDAIDRASAHGIRVGQPRLDWAALIEREQDFVRGVDSELEHGLRDQGIQLVRGKAHFVDRRIVEVDFKRYEARKVLVATGSTPRTLGIEGESLLTTSEDVLSDPVQPTSVIFIGAGVVAMELGHVLARAGSQVTLLEVADRPLAALDPDAVDRLLEETRALGINVRTGVRVHSVTKNGHDLQVRCEHGGQTHNLSARRVVNGAGRVANLEGLKLECAQVEAVDGRVQLDEQLRSRSNPTVYFAGDVVQGSPQLSAVASYEGRLVGRNILGLGADTLDYSNNPSVVFTLPNLAQVGLTERRAREQGLQYRVIAHDMTSWRSARSYAEPAAYAKVLVEEGTGRLLGAHLLGHGAAETIHAFAFAMGQGLSHEELRSLPMAYPTFHSDLKHLV